MAFPHRPGRLQRLLGALCLGSALALSIAACDLSSPASGNGSPPNPSGGPPPPGSVFAVAYDETSVTTTSRWPGDLAGRGSSSEFLLNYSSVHQAYQFSDAGDLSSTTNYLEGNSQTWLPADFHAAISDELPVPGGADPVTHYQIRNGAFSALTASGATAFSKQFPADAFRIPAEWVAAIRASDDSTVSAGARIARNRQALAGAGVALRELQGDRVVATQQGAGLTVQTVVNLRTGLAEVIETAGSDGRRASADVFTYEYFGPTPIATRVVTYTYGDASGSWAVDRKTDLTRTNVVVNR